MVVRRVHRRRDKHKLILCACGAFVLAVYLVNHFRKDSPKRISTIEFSPKERVIKSVRLPFAPIDKYETDKTDVSRERGQNDSDKNKALPFSQEVLKGIKDKTTSLERKPYYYLAHEVNKQTWLSLKQTADASISWRDVYQKPDKFRGKVLQVTGVLRRLRVTPLESGNPSGLERIFHGQVVDRDFRFWTFILTEKPNETILEGDLVRLYGRFFKIWEYQTNLPNTYKRTAVVVGKRLANVKIEKQSAMSKYIVLLTVTTIVFLFIAVRWSRREDKCVEEIRQSKTKSRRPPNINDLAKTLSSRATKERESL